MFAELIATEGVVEDAILRGSIGVMALHGGLEAGTAPAARRCARLAVASLYTVVQPQDFRWHVPSTRFDPTESQKLRVFLERVRLAVSFHGFGRRGFEGTVLVGGSNQRLGLLLGAAIERGTDLRVITNPGEIPPGLRGAHPRNPVNLPEFGGAQIELSPQARESGVLDDVVAAMAAVLAAEQAGVCAIPRPRNRPTMGL